MVLDHWSNGAMVSMDRCGLPCSETEGTSRRVFRNNVSSEKLDRPFICLNQISDGPESWTPSALWVCI